LSYFPPPQKSGFTFPISAPCILILLNININKLGFILIIMALEDFEKTVMKNINRNLGTDMTIEEIRKMPIDEYRVLVEEIKGRPLRFSYGTLPGASTDCDGSCSGLSLVGQEFMSSKECDKAGRDAVKVPWHEYVSRVYQWFKR